MTNPIIGGTITTLSFLLNVFGASAEEVEVPLVADYFKI